ncbi:MAG: hypothetical protein AAFX04_09965 [Pseudomonadota bacterium]
MFSRAIERFGALPMAAIAGVAIGAVTLVIHNSVFESIILAVGLNELIPAAAPPLGLTARIAIAVATALFVTGICAIMFSSWDDSDEDEDMDDLYENVVEIGDDMPRPGLAERLRAILPFNYGGDDGEVRELDDLPRMRRADSHPDAPARAPLLAGRDLAAKEPERANTAPALAGEDDSPVDNKSARRDRLKNLLPLELLRSDAVSGGDEPLVAKRRLDKDSAGDIAESVTEAEVDAEKVADESFTELPPATAGEDVSDAALLAAALAHADSVENPGDDEYDDHDVYYDHDEYDDAVPEWETPIAETSGFVGDIDAEEVALEEPVSDDMAEAAEDEVEPPLAELSIDALIDRLERGLDRLAAGRAEQVIEKVPAIATIAPVAPVAEEIAAPEEPDAAPEPMPVSLVSPMEQAFEPEDEAVAEVTYDAVPSAMDEEAASAGAETADVTPLNQPEDVDAALKAALETLRQMTDKQRNAS